MILVVTLLIIFTFLIYIFTIYRSKLPDPKPNNQESLDKMSNLNKVLSSFFGDNWRFTFFIFLILLFVLLYLLYFYSSAGINVNVSDKYYNTFHLCTVAFLIMFSVLIIVLSINYYLIYNAVQYDITNFQPALQDDANRKQIIEITGILLIIVGAVVFFIYRFFYMKKNKT